MNVYSDTEVILCRSALGVCGVRLPENNRDIWEIHTQDVTSMEFHMQRTCQGSPNLYQTIYPADPTCEPISYVMISAKYYDLSQNVIIIGWNDAFLDLSLLSERESQGVLREVRVEPVHHGYDTSMPIRKRSWAVRPQS